MARHVTFAVAVGPTGPVVAVTAAEMPEVCPEHPDHPYGPCEDCWAEYGVVTCHDGHEDFCPFDEP